MSETVTEINKDTFWVLIGQAKEQCGQDNPGVTGNQNSDTPTCAYSVIWDVRSSVKSGNGA